MECPHHYLPRDPFADNTIESDLFALGSALYEVVTVYKPHEQLYDEIGRGAVCSGFIS